MTIPLNIEPDTDAVTAYEVGYRGGRTLRGQQIYSTGQEKDFLSKYVDIPFRGHRHYALIRSGFLAGLRGETQASLKR
jgi:hypothetical protein